MMLDVFAFFPETDDEVIGISSADYIKEFFAITEILKKQNQWQLYYDENNLTLFLSKVEALGIYTADKSLRLRVGLNKLSAQKISSVQESQGSHIYFRYNSDLVLNIFYAEKILAEIAERIFSYNTRNYLLLNILNTIPTCRDRILVFKDAKHEVGLPEKFAHIDYVVDNHEIELWLKAKHNGTFSLLNKALFSRTGFIQHGKPVFQEISTRNYWYLDNFHKNEYEVFNSRREHIGVADLSGNIDVSKKEEDRTF